MREMNLNGEQAQEWSEETRRCLTQLNLLLAAYGELCETSGLPGGKAQYSDICDIIGRVSQRGPQALEDAVDNVCRRNTALLQARRSVDNGRTTTNIGRVGALL